MTLPRASGILLHPTSLPGPYGIGDFGPSAYSFIDFLVASGQRFWQTLPLNPTAVNGSPYSCISAFAGNTFLISPDELRKDDLLSATDLRQTPSFDSGAINFTRVQSFKEALLSKAFLNFKKSRGSKLHASFEIFKQRESYWLDDYALFRALTNRYAGKAWTNWKAELKRYAPAAVSSAREEFSHEIEAQKFSQFIFFKQWRALKSYCDANGIKVIGDLPIFVAHDSADVWAHQAQFQLDNDGNPTVVAGVPPDYFSETGQLWGNPHYNWQVMADDGFQWWIDRFKLALEHADLLRLDHFRGFAASWEIPAGDRTAAAGRWVDGPGEKFFKAVEAELGTLPIIAEDLGVITPDVENLRDHFNFPGMRVLQFAFSGDATNLNLPENYKPNSVAYTATHDNDTTVGWFARLSSSNNPDQILEREKCLVYLNSKGDEIHWDSIRTVFASVANTAIIPLQDLLGLGSEARMNTPNTIDGNWSWRFTEGALTDELAARLKQMSAAHGRNANPISIVV